MFSLFAARCPFPPFRYLFFSPSASSGPPSTAACWLLSRRDAVFYSRSLKKGNMHAYFVFFYHYRRPIGQWCSCPVQAALSPSHIFVANPLLSPPEPVDLLSLSSPRSHAEVCFCAADVFLRSPAMLDLFSAFVCYFFFHLNCEALIAWCNCSLS